MIGTGTLVNAAAVIAGTLIGRVLKNGIPQRIEEAIHKTLGLAVMFIGILGVVNNQGDTMMLVLSLILGTLIGEILKIEDAMNDLGERIKAGFLKNEGGGSDKFVEGFVSASLVYCVGAMAIVGSLNDGLLGDPSILYTKSILDGVSSVIFGASLGIGTAFSAIPILIYQGLITVLAKVLSPVLTDTLISNMSFVGNVLIFCIGLNFLFPKKLKVGNMFPAMFLPILLGFFIK